MNGHESACEHSASTDGQVRAYEPEGANVDRDAVRMEDPEFFLNRAVQESSASQHFGGRTELRVQARHSRSRYATLDATQVCGLPPLSRGALHFSTSLELLPAQLNDRGSS